MLQTAPPTKGKRVKITKTHTNTEGETTTVEQTLAVDDSIRAMLRLGCATVTYTMNTTSGEHIPHCKETRNQ